MSENIQQVSTAFTKIIGSRKVCVINLNDQPYVEEFKGENIVIPPNGERKVFMPFWKASKFKSSCIAPPAMDITGERVKGGMVKMIKVVELTEDERMKLGEMTPDELAAKQVEAEEALGNMCGQCGYQAKTVQGLKMHTTKNHPEAVAVE